MAIIKGSLTTATKTVQPQTVVDRFKKADVQQFDETVNHGTDVTDQELGAVIVTNRHGYRAKVQAEGTAKPRGRRPANMGVTVVANLLDEVPLSELRKYAEALLAIADEAEATGL